MLFCYSDILSKTLFISTHGQLNRDDGGLLPEASLHIVGRYVIIGHPSMMNKLNCQNVGL